MPGKKTQQKASPAKQPDQATAAGAAPKFEGKAAGGSGSCAAGSGCCGKVNDILLSGVYFAYAASAAFSAYTWCRDGLSIPRDFAALSDALRAGCEHAKANDLSVPLTLHKAWHAEVFTAKNDDVTLRTIFLLANFVCALPLALVMLFGTKCGSCWQKPALIHATMMFVLALHTVVENFGAMSGSLVFKCASVIVLGAPLALLCRWWKLDKNASGCGICRVFCFFAHLVAFFGCVYCFIILGEWAASKTGQEVTLVSPLIHQYTDEAFLHAKTHLGGVATAVAAKIEELTK